MEFKRLTLSSAIEMVRNKEVLPTEIAEHYLQKMKEDESKKKRH